MTTIFTDQTPVLADANDNTPYTLATLWTPSVDGTVTHGRWRFPGTLPSQPVAFALYQRTSDAAGVELATATFVDPVAGTWNTTPITPTEVAAGAFYYAAIWTFNRYVATVGFFTGTSVISGELTAPADEPGRRNGRFNDFGSSPNYPDDGGGACYFPDIVYEPGDIVIPDIRAGSTPTVAARRTAVTAVAATRTASPAITGRTSTSTVTGG